MPGREKPLKIIINDSSNITDLVVRSDKLATGAYTKKNTLYIAGQQPKVHIISTIIHEAIHCIAQHIGFKAHVMRFKEAHFEFSMNLRKLAKMDNMSVSDKNMLKHFRPAFASSYDDYRDEELMARVGEVLFLLDIEEASQWLELNAPKLFSIFKDEFLHTCKLYLQSNKLLDVEEDSIELLPNLRLSN